MYDIAVIGAGPGGYVAALRAAKGGAKVALIEKGETGGVCLNRGCIPTKAMIASAHALDMARRLEEFGIAGGAKLAADMKAIQGRKNKIVEKLRSGIETLLKAHKVDVVRSEASFKDTKTLRTSGGDIEAKHFIIATGSSWIDLPNMKADRKNIVTSDEALSWDELPSSLVIIGGGVIGCEFACMLNSFGTKVSVVEAMPSILPNVEGAISRLLSRSMKARGIEIFTGTAAKSVEISSSDVKTALSTGAELSSKKLMIAVGRRAYTKGLNLDAAGVKTDAKGFIAVDGNLRTSVPHIFAIGDVRGGKMLAHAASSEAIAAVDFILGKSKEAYVSAAIPSPIFTNPEIAAVGKTSEELRKDGVDFETGRFPYAASGKALCDGEEEGQVIVHADAKSAKILGVHIFGKDATLIIAEAALAMENGLTVHDVERTIHAHPTLSEVLAEGAADVLGMAVHKASRA
jgi:dihydrolipoamide dehydrogenase